MSIDAGSPPAPGKGLETGRPAPESSGVFATTHWSIVLRAGRKETAQSQLALEQLCRAYWYPLYAYVRRRGYSSPDAQDLTQEFFSRLLQKKWLLRADRAKGRFRSFLLSAMEHFLANEWDKAHALKRGGGLPLAFFEGTVGETRFNAEPVDARTPEKAFERSWAVALLAQVVERLQAEYRAEGKEALFVSLRSCLVGEGETLPYGKAARHLGVSEGAVRVLVHRLRQRYRALLRAEIANTVCSSEEVDAEMRHLFKVLSAG